MNIIVPVQVKCDCLGGGCTLFYFTCALLRVHTIYGMHACVLSMYVWYACYVCMYVCMYVCKRGMPVCLVCMYACVLCKRWCVVCLVGWLIVCMHVTVTSMYVWYACVSARANICALACMYMCARVYVRVRVRVCVCMYVCMYV